MWSLLTIRPIRAKTHQIMRADGQRIMYVAQRAPGTQGAEAALVVRAQGPLRVRVDVQEEALVAVGAVLMARVVDALWHASEVVLVQELAGFALFAEGAQPVLADKAVKGGQKVSTFCFHAIWGKREYVLVVIGWLLDVPVCTARPVRAVPLCEGLAYGPGEPVF